LGFDGTPATRSDGFSDAAAVTFWRNLLAKQTDLILVMGVVCILLVLVTPIPPQLLDFLLITNMSLALLVLLLTFYVDKPLKFSTFPSLLLIATLFRLSLNIAATRLILSDADAGRVIEAIGTHVVAGNYVIGMIVFLVLVVVQYIVVTNGAQRVAEVAARFTLDGMPGKQMSIDADLNMGLIDEREAQARRKEIEKEANFYGAMDGASKFVKGDAIAGIIIILIDIIGGLTIGIAQMDMRFAEALQTFTLLTIGDGIVTQIPALIIATGTGIIVTRAASDEFLSREISRQVTAYPKTLAIIATVLLVALFLPGLPVLPVLLVMSLVCALFWAARRASRARSEEVEGGVGDEAEVEDLYELMAVEPIEVKVGQDLIPLVGGDDSLMMGRVGAFRKQFAMEAGVVIPRIRAKDDKRLPPHRYELRVFDAKVGEGEILPDRMLAINPGDASGQLEGVEVKDPTFGLPGVWILDDDADKARGAGFTVVEPLQVLMTHLTESLKRDTPNLLTRAETERLVNRIRERDTGLIEELIPNVMTLSDVQKVLQGLLAEKISIRNLDQILEVLVDAGKQTKDTRGLIELVRSKLGPTICQALADGSGALNALVLDPSVEAALASGIRTEGSARRMVVEPKLAEQVLTRLSAYVEKMMGENLMPVLLCAPELRPQLRQFTERVIPHLAIVSMSEVPNTLPVKSFGMVKL
jgi:flagellar biosynthesis protein FlhA